MGVPKCRLDVWNPVIGGTATNKWVTAQNPDNNNALISVFFMDKLANPKRAEIVVSNRAKNYTSTGTFNYHYQNSDGDNVFVNPGVELQERHGVLTEFFRDFMHIRIIDLETNVALFTGRLVDIDVNYNANTGTSIKLKAYDALDELRRITPRGLSKDITFYAYDEIEQEGGHLGHSVTDITKGMVSLAYKKEFFQLREVQSINAFAKGPANVTTDLMIADTVYYPDSTTNQYRTNIVTDDDGTVLKNRFQTDATPIPSNQTIDLTKIGNKGVLGVILDQLVHKPQESEADDNDGFGWDYFVDSNISYGSHADFRGKNLDASTKPPPAMLNIWERGKRIYNIEPATYGLAVKYPSSTAVVSQGARTTYVSSVAVPQYATKPMSVTFDFDHPKEGLYTGVLLKYNDKDEKKDEAGEKTKKGGKGQEKEVKMDIIYGQILGDFAWRTVTGDPAQNTAKVDPFDIGDDLAPETSGTAGRPGLHSAEYLDLHSGTSPYAKLHDNVARVQYQSNDGSGSDYDYILISHVGPELLNVAAGTYRLYGVGDGEGYNGSNAMITVNLGATVASQGYPRRVWGIEKVHTLSKGEITEPNKLRQEVASILSRSSIDIVNGSFEMSGKPQYFWDGEIKTVAGATVGQTISFQDLGQTAGAGAAKDLTRYGFREGMVIAKMTGTFGAIAQAELSGDGVFKDVYGYCWDIPSDTTYCVDLEQAIDFSVGDKVRCFIPVRAGDTIRVENILANVAGNHLVTEIEYTEEPNQNTKFKTTGVNEGFGLLGSRFQAILAGTREESDLRYNLPKGHQVAIWTGLFSAVDANTVQWQTVGGKAEVALADGTIYNVDCATTNNNHTTHASGTDSSGNRFGIVNAAHPVAGGTDKTIYYIYLDPNVENVGPTAKVHFYTRPATSPTNGSDPVYDQDGDNIIIGWMRAASSTTGLAEFGVYRDSQPGGGKSDLANIAHVSSATSALLKKGAQTFTTDLMIEGSGATSGDMWKEVKWHGGETGNDTTNATLTLADGDERVIAYGGDSGNDTNGSYVIGTASGGVGSSVSYANVNAFTVNRTYYGYVDFAEQPTGDLILRWTLSSHVAYGDDRILLAMIVIPPDSTKGNSPIIIPLTTKSMSVNAVSIAANAISADHITTTAIDTTHLKVTGSNGISGLTSAGLIRLDNAGSLAGNLSLDNTADGSARKTVTAGEKTGASNAATGLGTGGRVVQPIGTGEGGKFFSYASNSSNTSLVVIDNLGIVGYSHTSSMGTFTGSGTFAGFDVSSATKQFEIRADDGRGYFGESKVRLGSDGMYIMKEAGQSAGGITWEHSTGSGDTFLHKVNGANNIRFIADSTGTADNAVLFSTWIGNASFKVPQGHFTNLYTYEMTATGQITNTRSSTGTPSFHATAAPAQFDLGLWFRDETSVPNPSSSSYIRLYSESNVLKYKNSSGNVTTVGGASEGDDYQWTGLHKFDNAGGILLKNQSSVGATAPTGYSKLISILVAGDRKLAWLDDDGEVDIISDIDHTASGGGGGGGSGEANENSFKYIAVSGQNTVAAETDTDTLNLAAGANITLTTNHNTDTITIEAAGGGGGSYTHPDPIRLGDGTQSNPTYSFTNASGNGMYRASNTLKWSLTGDDTMQLYATGLSVWGQNLQVKDGSLVLPVRDGTDGEVDVQYGNSGFFYKVSSSAKTKMNIRDLDIDSSAVYSLVPKSFEGKAKVLIEDVGWEETGEAGGTMFGLIAEEVEKILPALVTYDENEEPSNVDYKMISVLLVEEMKKLKDRIEVLENA